MGLQGFDTRDLEGTKGGQKLLGTNWHEEATETGGLCSHFCFLKSINPFLKYNEYAADDFQIK